jgi:hypothetical protein
MIEREMCEMFLGKRVALLFRDTGKDILRRGKLLKVTDSTVLLDFNGVLQAYAIESIIHIREHEDVPIK